VQHFEDCAPDTLELLTDSATQQSAFTFSGWLVVWLLTSLLPQNSINTHLDFKLILLFDRYSFSNFWYTIACLHTYYTNRMAE
jgi:hypothetical protein